MKPSAVAFDLDDTLLRDDLTISDFTVRVLRTLQKEGVHAVTYMPTRNTREQLVRLRALCEQYQMFQVSGEDINSPRQSFVIEAMRDPMFGNLIDATWKLIDHEKEEKD